MAWVERFMTAGAAASKDGKDTVGFNLSGATYTHVGTSITKAGAFAAYTWASGDYICISSATEGKTNSLYLIASRTSDDVIVLGTYIAGGGAFTGNQTDVTSATGPWDFAAAIAGAAAGDRVNVKAGSGGCYDNTTNTRTIVNSGSTTAPIWWRGYKTTIGDKDTAGGSRTAGTDIPLWTWTTGRFYTTATYQTFSNIDFTSAYVASARGTVSMQTGGYFKFIRCRIENTSANASSYAFYTDIGVGILVGCRLKATTTAGYVSYSSGHMLYYGCHVIGGVTGLCTSSTGHITALSCIVEGFTTNGIRINGGAYTGYVDHCSIYSSGASSVAILITLLPGTGNVFIGNSILYCVTGISNAVGTNTHNIFLFNNHFVGCTNNVLYVTELSVTTDGLWIANLLIDEDTDPFVAKAGNNFTLAPTNNVDRGGGFPGVFEGQTIMVGYPDIGAVGMEGHPHFGDMSGGKY